MNEIKVWLPNYLNLTEKNEIVWAGNDKLPEGTVLHPYQFPTLQTLNPNHISDKIKQVNQKFF